MNVQKNEIYKMQIKEHSFQLFDEIVTMKNVRNIFFKVK